VGIWHWLATYLLVVAGVIAIVFGTIATVYFSFVVQMLTGNRVYTAMYFRCG
jgi:hypothetical protein